jgi:hypothetical protein
LIEEVSVRPKNSLLLVFLLCGCAGGARYEEVEHKLPEVPRGMGRIYFLREAHYALAAIQQKITVNGEVVGRSVPGGFFFVDVPAGRHEVSCDKDQVIAIPVAVGESVYVETVPGGSVLFRDSRVRPLHSQQGEILIRRMRYTGENGSLPDSEQ